MSDLSVLRRRAPSSDDTSRFALLRAGAIAAAFVICAAAGTIVAGGSAPVATLTAFVSVTGMATGYLFGRPDHAAAKASQLLMLRAADDLIQYRAFTRLLRDQGSRIVASTAAAAVTIVEGLSAMDLAVERLRTLTDQEAAVDVEQLRSLTEAIGSPVIEMLGQLQFQDVTQQQIAFLSRLSVILDDHLTQLARQLNDRRATKRLDRFEKMFEEALNDCVMDGQRDDIHAAAGVAVREEASPKLELF